VSLDEPTQHRCAVSPRQPQSLISLTTRGRLRLLKTSHQTHTHTHTRLVCNTGIVAAAHTDSNIMCVEGSLCVCCELAHMREIVVWMCTVAFGNVFYASSPGERVLMAVELTLPCRTSTLRCLGSTWIRSARASPYKPHRATTFSLVNRAAAVFSETNLLPVLPSN